MTTNPIAPTITPSITETTIGGVTRYSYVPVDSLVANLCAMTKVWNLRSTTRRHLGQLDDRCLRDIGIERMDAMKEAGKWFWQE